MPAGAFEPGARHASGPGWAPGPALPSELAVLAQPDLQKDQAGREDEPEADEHEGEYLSNTSAHEHGAQRSGDDEGSRGAEADNAPARGHGDVKPWTVGLIAMRLTLPDAPVSVSVSVSWPRMMKPVPVTPPRTLTRPIGLTSPAPVST